MATKNGIIANRVAPTYVPSPRPSAWGIQARAPSWIQPSGGWSYQYVYGARLPSSTLKAWAV